jgi:hypothetical protein
LRTFAKFDLGIPEFVKELKELIIWALTENSPFSYNFEFQYGTIHDNIKFKHGLPPGGGLMMSSTDGITFQERMIVLIEFDQATRIVNQLSRELGNEVKDIYDACATRLDNMPLGDLCSEDDFMVRYNTTDVWTRKLELTIHGPPITNYEPILVGEITGTPDTIVYTPSTTSLNGSVQFTNAGGV